MLPQKHQPKPSGPQTLTILMILSVATPLLAMTTWRLPRFYLRPEARMGDVGKEPEAEPDGWSFCQPDENEHFYVLVSRSIALI